MLFHTDRDSWMYVKFTSNFTIINQTLCRIAIIWHLACLKLRIECTNLKKNPLFQTDDSCMAGSLNLRAFSEYYA